MNLRPFRTLPDRLRRGNSPEEVGLAATYRTLLETASQAQRARVPQMAAALTYRTIFGLLPVIIVGLVTIKFWYSQRDIEELIRKLLDTTGISAIVVEDNSGSTAPPQDVFGPPAPNRTPSTTPPNNAPPGALPSALPAAPTPESNGTNEDELSPDEAAEIKAAEAAAQPATAQSTRRLDEWIQEILKRVDSISFATLGLIGLAALIYAALGMLVEIERAFNQIYRVPSGRSWSRRLVLYWTLLSLGPLGLVATFYVGSQFRGWADSTITQSLSGVSTGLSALSVVALGYLSTVTISAAILLLLYLAVPNARVKFWPALAGAVLAALAWEAGKWGLAQYIDYTRGRSYVNLYGSVALFPLFLLWVYFTWVIILMGLQLAFQAQYRKRPDPASILADTRSAITDPSSVLQIMALVGKGFAAGRGLSARKLAPTTGMPEPVVAVMLRQLQDRGFLHPVAKAVRKARTQRPTAADDADEPAATAQPLTPDLVDALSGNELLELATVRYTLARPPGQIRLADVLECAHAMTPNGRWGLSGEVDRAGPTESKDDSSIVIATGGPIPREAEGLPSPEVSRVLREIRASERRALGDQTVLNLVPELRQTALEQEAIKPENVAHSLVRPVRDDAGPESR